MISDKELDFEREIEIKALTDEIAIIREQRESLKREFQGMDDECSSEILALTKKRLKLVNERKYRG